jgi:hypothetical protein
MNNSWTLGVTSLHGQSDLAILRTGVVEFNLLPRGIQWRGEGLDNQVDQTLGRSKKGIKNNLEQRPNIHFVSGGLEGDSQLSQCALQRLGVLAQYLTDETFSQTYKICLRG